jgi:hypothetical protein
MLLTAGRRPQKTENGKARKGRLMAVILAWMIGLAPGGITLALTLRGHLPGWAGYPLAILFFLLTILMADQMYRVFYRIEERLLRKKS